MPLMKIVFTLFPMVLIMSIGWLWAYRSEHAELGQKILTDYIINVSLPALLFIKVATNTYVNLIDFHLLTIYFCCIIGLFTTIFFISAACFKQPKDLACIKAFTSSFPDMAFLGLPILILLKKDHAILSVIVGNIITGAILIPLTMFILEKETRTKPKRVFTNHLFSLLKKPLFILPFVGILFAKCHIPIAPPLKQGLLMLGQSTSAVALFTLGTLVYTHPLKINKDTLFNSTTKLVIQPLVMLALVMIFNIPKTIATDAILLMAMPSAVITGLVAKQYNTYTIEASSTVVLSTLLSLLSLAGIIHYLY